MTPEPKGPMGFLFTRAYPRLHAMKVHKKQFYVNAAGDRFQRVFAAFFAISRRLAALSFFALAGPPFMPPNRPSSTAAGFFFR